jgi:hypothetical protein
VGWDFKHCVDFIRKNASRADSDVLGVASRPYGDKHKIFLAYYSMPDWLAIATTAVVPGGAVPSAKGPVVNVLIEMELEAGRSLSEVFLFNFMSQADLKQAFASLVAAYRRAAKNHQDGVAKLLDQIVGKTSGVALLTELGRTKFALHVMPYWHFFFTMPDMDFYNSTSKGVASRAMLGDISDTFTFDYGDTYAKGAPVRGNDNEPLGKEKGTGKGANVVLFFSARTWTSPWDWPDKPNGPGFLPDEVLFHELVHTTRLLRGKQTHIAVAGRPNFGNIEEYFATVIANIYLSEKGQDARLRGVYSPRGPNPPKDWSVMMDPDKFYDNVDRLSISPHDLMQMFSATQIEFYNALARLPVPPKFNPAKRHFEDAGARKRTK